MSEKKKRSYKWLLILVSFWIPFVGVYMYLINRKDNPKEARIYLIAFILGFVANYVLLTIRSQ